MVGVKLTFEDQVGSGANKEFMYGDTGTSGYSETVTFDSEVIGLDFVDGTNDIEGIIFLESDDTVQRVGRDIVYKNGGFKELNLDNFEASIYSKKLEGRLLGFNMRFGLENNGPDRIRSVDHIEVIID